jgi:hypothetical protein
MPTVPFAARRHVAALERGRGGLQAPAPRPGRTGRGDNGAEEG